MSSPEMRQTSDRANASGEGTKGLSENQPDVLKASSLQDGGASNKGQKEPQGAQP